MHAFALGFGLGFFVALQLGPMSLLLVRTTLRAGWLAGLAIGVGIAVVDALYAACGAAGAAPFLAFEPVRLALGLVGAAVLVGLGVRTLYSAFRVRLGGELDAEVATPRRAFLTSLAGTASNPLTIASWAAIFAAASAASLATTVASAVVLVLGVGLGSMVWFAILSFGMAMIRRRVPPTGLRVADGVAGVGLIGFGAALGYGSLQHRP